MSETAGERLVRQWFGMVATRFLQMHVNAEVVVVMVNPDGASLVLTPTSADDNEAEELIFERKIRLLTLALAAEALDGPGGIRRTVGQEG